MLPTGLVVVIAKRPGFVSGKLDDRKTYPHVEPFWAFEAACAARAMVVLMVVLVCRVNEQEDLVAALVVGRSAGKSGALTKLP